MMKRIINKIKKVLMQYIAYRNDDSKRDYLRNQGAIIGDGTRFIGKPFLGTEPYLIEIGEDCLISDNVVFHTHDGGVKVLNGAGYFGKSFMDKMARIKVGNNCFIGSCVHLLGGGKIGDNVIIGTMSVVTKDIPNNVVAAGIPAKMICTLDEFYNKNMERGRFYSTAKLTPQQRIDFLKREVR